MSDDKAVSTDRTATTDETPSEIKPEISESAREAAAEMASAYEDRPTAVLPGSHNTVTGTAVNDWLDDDGNPKYGKTESDQT